MRIIQILGDGIEELWQFPDNVKDEEIKNIHEKYENEEDYEDYEDFEHYLNESFSQMNGQKLIVHDIFITQPSRYDY